MNKEAIIQQLPYAKPFLFVDDITHIDTNGVTGTFTYDANLDFYRGHFKDHPITPGVILTETMAQIGVVCLGIYLTEEEQPTQMALTSSEIEFLQPVYPNETVTVISEKIYFRFGKLKCNVRMLNSRNEEVSRGTIAGMLVNR
ncbi:3-hydroxyacyl-ACP dehydratase FabZ family protein [Flavobacterium orientale]|uniref:Beta-hydroxyacyl-ACP dehydratase n=1 Tax=Flavobacterium orientale TaxID=1756020 RepID=A0A916XZI4_9FLAO|nr:3-hydroxyacyl-ACP dehydratase FabZ family protein [Flavobacterium orientale]GGD24060.1 beta-hydroxyacyl-ACP dehydratase [Flavobacterium orientale]